MKDRSDHDRWQQIDALFSEALALDPSEWESFLDSADPELRAAVADLLHADVQSAAFLHGSLEDVAADELAAALEARGAGDPSNRVGERVGAFRIVRQIGRGGMAGVYLAERVEGGFQQTVAIKFLRRGLDTDDFVRRFMSERQILSGLSHPNIARLIDGGTTERDLPFLALEYVDGLPITEFCDERRNSIEDRLRLFLDVASAVQYAHTNLIVHRDIKPSNILVTPDGQVKLLDFGIAKLLDPQVESADADLTRTGLRPMTPNYASPEQVRGEPITTASDVYQLGVLLYRLLTGQRPYERGDSGASLQDTITTALPTLPSRAVLDVGSSADNRNSTPERLSRRLRGDLDTIVFKALRKEPARRYGSAVEMAEDVRRHLDGRPIDARRESRRYRAGKFLRRNPWVLPVVAVLTLLLGTYVTTLLRHGQQLEDERNVARDVQQAFVSFFTAPDSGDVGLGEGRRDLTILEAILDGTDRVRRDLADRPAARAELFGAMAAVLEDLDEPSRGYELAVEALELEITLYGSESPQVQETLLRVGNLHADADSARVTLEKAIALSERLYGADDPVTGNSLYALADLDLRQGKLEDAVRGLERAIEIYRNSGSVHATRLAWALGDLAENLGPLGRTDDAVGAASESYEILSREFGEQHSQTATTAVILAKALSGAGRLDEARRLYEAGLRVLDSELGATHATTLSVRNNYAVTLTAMGDLHSAEDVYRRQLEAQRERYGEVHSEVAASLQNLAVGLKKQGRYDEAERLSLAAHEMFAETKGLEFYQTAFPLLTIAEIRLLRGEFVAAEEVSRDALELLRTSLPPGNPITAIAECRVGQALAGQGNAVEARVFLEAGADVLRSNESRSAYLDECLATLEAL